MAVPSVDHPGFTWLLRLLESRSEPDSGDSEATGDVPGRWVISDGERAVAVGGNLGALLERIPGEDFGRFAVAFWRFSNGKPSSGSWEFGAAPGGPSPVGLSEFESALENVNAPLTR